MVDEAKVVAGRPGFIQAAEAWGINGECREQPKRKHAAEPPLLPARSWHQAKTHHGWADTIYI